MTNFEKYYKDLKRLVSTKELECSIYRLRTRNSECVGFTCYNCRKESLEWLHEEYKEPEVDWSKVKRGTPVMVSCFYDGALRYCRKFFAYDSTLDHPFVTYTDDEKTLINWDCCELAEENDNE